MSYTCKLPITRNDCIVLNHLGILNTEWSKQEVNMLLYHDNKAWNGKFQIAGDEEVAELLDQLSMSEEEYLEETKTALTTHGGALKFAYSIENDKFIWKKYVGDKMTVKFGYVSISKAPEYYIFENIIDNTLESFIDTSNKLAIIVKEKEALEKENLHLKTKCNDLIDKKSEMETLLYSQFLCVLNEKKKKIEELKQKLEPSHHVYESDSCHSDGHYGSETEIDSEDDTHSTSTLEFVERKETHEPEKKSKFMLPKRSKQSGNQESILAGPSGISNQLAKNNSKDLVSLEKSNGSVLRKSQRNRCTEKTTVRDISKNNSEEDEFTFPKRSRKTKIFTNTTTVSKFNYESDDETITKIEPESYSASNEISNDAVNNSDDKSDEMKKNDCERFSSSTLDILNHMV